MRTLAGVVAAILTLGTIPAISQDQPKTVHILYSSSSHGYFDPCG